MKEYRGQRFFPIKSAEQAEADLALRAKHKAMEGAMPIEAWFQVRGVRDSVRRAGMLGSTPVREAPLATFDEMFRDL